MLNSKNQNVWTVALMLAGFIYLFIGAVIFRYLEEDDEKALAQLLAEKESEIRAKYNISADDMDNLRKTLIDREPYRKATQWDFVGSLYFSMIVLTTIGYGHSVPHTKAGKAMCMAYSLVGVPIYLVMFQAMGERINTSARNLIKRLGRRLRMKAFNKPGAVGPLIPFGMVSCALTVVLGTFMFSHFENWSLLDSAYYCVITLTTIGFGDFVPLLSNRALQDRPSYVAFSLIYIVTGLAVIGAFVNLVVLRLMVSSAAASAAQEKESSRPTTGNAIADVPGRNTEDVELTKVGQGFDNEHAFLPNVNGDLKARGVTRRRTDNDWIGGVKPTRRRPRSLKIAHDEKSRFSLGRNSRTSHYGDGDYFNISGELYINDRFNRSKLPCTDVATTGVASSSWSSSDGECTMPKKPRTMSHNDLRLYQNDHRNKGQNKKSDSCSGYKDSRCIICQKCCPVCGSLFSSVNRADETSDYGKNRDLISRRATFDNNNENNNTASTTTHDSADSQCSVATSANVVETPSNADEDKLHRTSNRLSIHSLPSCSHPNSKSFLELYPHHRPRNHSLDSGYEGMVAISQSEKFADNKRFTEPRSVSDRFQAKKCALNSEEESEKLKSRLRDYNGDQAYQLKVPTLSDNRDSPTVEDQDCSSFTTTDDFDLSASLSPSNYDTILKPKKQLSKETTQPLEAILSRTETVNATSSKSNDPDKLPISPITPSIIVTTCEENAFEERIIVPDLQKHSSQQNHDEKISQPEKSTWRHSHQKAFHFDLPLSAELKNNICSVHLRDFERIHELLQKTTYDVPILNIPTNQDESDSDPNIDVPYSSSRGMTKCIYDRTTLDTTHPKSTSDNWYASLGDSGYSHSFDDCETWRKIRSNNQYINNRNHLEENEESFLPKHNHSDNLCHHSGYLTRNIQIKDDTNLHIPEADSVYRRPTGTTSGKNSDCGNVNFRRDLPSSRRRDSFERIMKYVPMKIRRARSFPLSHSRLSTDSSRSIRHTSAYSSSGSTGHEVDDDFSNIEYKFKILNNDGSCRMNSRNEMISTIPS